jgi:hypothetical protein
LLVRIQMNENGHSCGVERVGTAVFLQLSVVDRLLFSPFLFHFFRIR